MSRLLAGLFFFHLVIGVRGAEEKSLIEQLTVDQSSWKVVFAPTVNLGLDSEGLTRAGALPRQLHKAISDFKTHILGPEEKLFLRRQSRAKLLQKKYKDVLAEIKKRDEVIFKETSTSKRAEEIAKVEKKITELREKIKEINDFPLAEIPVPDTLRIQASWVDNVENYQGSLYSIDKEDADLVLWPDMTGLQGAYLVNLYAHYRMRREVEEIWTGALTKGNSAAFDQVRDFLATTLLNRSWANLEITLQPKEGRIYLDGQLTGVGSIQKYGLEAGHPYEVEVYPQGYASFRKELTLEAYTTTRLVWPLQPQQEEFITIDSGEVSAEVYLGSRFAGYTPLRIRRPDYSQTLTLLAIGYLPYSQTLAVDAQDDISVVLARNPALTAKEEKIKRKEDFYWSASALTASLLVPLISGGIADNAAAAAAKNREAGFQDVAARYQTEETVARVVMGSGLVLSAGLLVWTAVNLVGYLQTIERDAQPDIRDTYPPAEEDVKPDEQQEKKQPDGS